MVKIKTSKHVYSYSKATESDKANKNWQKRLWHWTEWVWLLFGFSPECILQSSSVKRDDSNWMLELEDKDFRISFCKYDRGMKEIMILMNVCGTFVPWSGIDPVPPTQHIESQSLDCQGSPCRVTSDKIQGIANFILLDAAYFFS